MSVTYFIRTKDNKTIADVEVNFSRKFNGIDVLASINIENYSALLLSVAEDKRKEVIQRFDALSELRGWFFEVFLPVYTHEGYDAEETYRAAKINVAAGMKEICEKFDLCFVED